MSNDDWGNQAIGASFHAAIVVLVLAVVVIWVAWRFFGINMRNKGRLLLASIALTWWSSC